jgi:membrane fusion protein (multidrug efflux system)
MIVGPNDVVEGRAVTVGDLRAESWVVLSGLAAGDRVIVDGLQKVQAGQPVRVVTEQEAPASPQPPVPPSR